MPRRLLCRPTMILAAAAFFGLATNAFSDPLGKPSGPIVLTVAGRIENTNGSHGTAQFDLAMLDALAQHEGTMQTPWTKGLMRFRGPLGRALMKAVGAMGSSLKVTALNDYSAEIPVDDLTKWNVIFATRMNGKILSIRDKGPLFLIYPFDQDPVLYNERYFARSVWQIKSIDVE